MTAKYYLDMLDGTEDDEFWTPNCACGAGVHIYVLDSGAYNGHEDWEDRLG